MKILTKISHSTELELTQDQISKITMLGGDSIVGDMLDDNFTINENNCKKYHIYNGCVFIVTVDRDINVI